MKKFIQDLEVVDEQELAQRLGLDPVAIKNAVEAGLLQSGRHYFTLCGRPRFLWPDIVENLAQGSN